jgi:hypothetical protein
MASILLLPGRVTDFLHRVVETARIAKHFDMIAIDALQAEVYVVPAY